MMIAALISTAKGLRKMRTTKKITASELENRALRLTSVGALSMAILGLGFAVITKSEAILLDGFFSLIGFAITLLTRKVSRLVVRPGDQQYPFGYATFEPMLNLCKGLLISLTGLFALMSAISALFTGGRPIVAGVAIAYAALAALGSFWVAWRIGRMSRRSRSALVKVDAKNWMIDGILSAAVAVTFLVVELTKSTPFSEFAPYADPMIVIVLVLTMASFPIKTIRNAWRQLVGYCPDSAKLGVINTAVEDIFKPAATINWQVRSLEVGRFIYVQIYVFDPYQWSGDLVRQDQLRSQLYADLTQHFPYLQLDVIFTQQPEWLNWSFS